MSEPLAHPALRRLLADVDTARASALLSQNLAGAELTTLLLGVASDRVARLTSADVLRQHQYDRFVAPAPVDGLTLARVELLALEAAAPEFEPVALAPVAPLGTHHVLGGTPQNNVVTTMRQSEVTADPTNSLALEAAVRRQHLLAADPKSTDVVKLSAAHRVTRAQHFEGPRSFAHFSLLGLVSAGRDQGNYSFETQAVREHLNVLIDVVRSVTDAAIQIRFSPFNPEVVPHCETLAEEIATDTVSGSLDLDRDHGRGYYRSLCFKLDVEADGERFELGDGGDVWWTQDLLDNRKERLVIGGLGLERLALLALSETGQADQA